MKGKTRSISEQNAALRRRAEEIALRQPEDIARLSPEELRRAVHELHIHQIELEMQNEELRRAQSDLEASRDRFSGLYNYAPVGYLTVSGQDVILEANMTVATMLGAEPARLINRPLTRLILKEDQDIYYFFRKALFGTLEPQACELRLIKADGASFDARLIANATGADGATVCRVSVSDITERKLLEEELQKNRKLESLGVLAAGVAHDFNNLLGGIFGNIEIAAEERDEKMKSKYLAKALSTINRTRALTGQLLTFAKGGEPVKKLERLAPFIESSAKFALGGSNVCCRFSISDELWACEFDKHQIGQVIDNIVINARQAMPEGGTIEITAENLRSAEKSHPTLSKGNYVKVAVKDHGTGMPKEMLPKIFDPFFSTKVKGHGLGLATCYSIIKRHGGCIDVESEAGKGSTFTFYLPALPGALSPAISAVATTNHGIGAILVMDDEEVMRDAFGSMLETMGYTVHCVVNSQEAMEKFGDGNKGKNRFSAVILDLTIPGGPGGKETIREIRKIDKDIPAFVASGYADDPVMANPSEYGFNGSICKPFTKSELSKLMITRAKQP